VFSKVARDAQLWVHQQLRLQRTSDHLLHHATDRQIHQLFSTHLSRSKMEPTNDSLCLVSLICNRSSPTIHPHRHNRHQLLLLHVARIASSTWLLIYTSPCSRTVGPVPIHPIYLGRMFAVPSCSHWYYRLICDGHLLLRSFSILHCSTLTAYIRHYFSHLRVTLGICSRGTLKRWRRGMCQSEPTSLFRAWCRRHTCFKCRLWGRD